MFKSISWQEYLLAVSVIGGGYYVVVIVIFYSRDVIARLKGVATPKSLVSPVRTERERSGNFMGAIQQDVPRRKIVTEATVATEEITVHHEAKKLLTPAEEIIEQLDGIFNMMLEGVIEKSRYIKSIKSIIRDCWKYKGTSVQNEVAKFIVNHFSGNAEVSFTLEEIDILWPSQDVESNVQSTTINKYEKEKRSDQKG